MLLAFPAEAQTVEVPAQQLERAKAEIERLRARDSTQQQLIANLKAQISTLDRITTQDSIIIASQKERLRIRRRRLEWRKQQAEEYRKQKWLYAAGTGVLVFLGAIASK